MALLDIRVLGDPVLRKITSRVTTVTSDLHRLAEDMFETMHAAKGIGLAAPQVGRTERMAVVEIEGERHVLINPEILSSEGSSVREEGCLSIPDVYANVSRPAIVRVRALGLDGKPWELTATDLLGTCIQHEMDHLEGRMFIDRLSLLKRRAALKAWDEVKEEYPDLVRRLTKADVEAHHNDEAL